MRPLLQSLKAVTTAQCCLLHVAVFGHVDALCRCACMMTACSNETLVNQQKAIKESPMQTSCADPKPVLG